MTPERLAELRDATWDDIDWSVVTELLAHIDALEAEREQLIATSRLLRLQVERYRKHDLGHLFCWCVQNLEKFPPIQGEWEEEVKRRLLEAAQFREDAERWRTLLSRLSELGPETKKAVESFIKSAVDGVRKGNG